MHQACKSWNTAFESDWLLKRIIRGELSFKIADGSGVVFISGGGFGDVHECRSRTSASSNIRPSGLPRKLLDGYYELDKAEVGGAAI